MSNPAPLITWKSALAAVLVFAVATVVPGCLGDFVKVKTPTGAVAAGVAESLSYNDSVDEYNDQLIASQTMFDAWGNRLETAGDKITFWNSALSALTTPEALTAFGFNPVGGGLMAVTFLGGLLIKRPRDVTPTEHSKGKIASFNKGHEIASKFADNINGD